MTPELDERLVKEFPLLYSDRHAPMTQTAMCWGFQCGDGWYKLIRKLSKKLEKLVEKEMRIEPVAGMEDILDEYLFPHASTVKEKFGTLRFYMTTSTDEMEAEIDKAIRESARTCEDCGRPGRNKSVGGWYRTQCVKCRNKWKKEMTDD